jgi:hypothetical protein
VGENVRSRSLVDEVQAYQQLLLRHGFLRFSSDGREYSARRMVAIDGIAEALQQTTGVRLPVIHEEVQLENLREVIIQSIQRLMRQTIRSMKLTLRTFEPHS